MSYYRLELLPTEEGRVYYTGVELRNNDNAGFDMFVAVDTETITSPTLIDLGCKARMVCCSSTGEEEDVHYWLAPRSSIWKNGVMFVNSMGVIDRSYRGILKACVLPISMIQPVKIKEGTRICQILAPDMGWIRDIRIVDSLPETTRGEGGFGSTGR
jgi:deoxyuridine 5'-triphosphate nucleotidohydrolase